MSLNVQELEHSYEQAATERKRAEILLDICRYYMHRDAHKMLEYAEQAEVHARRARVRESIAAALRYRGLALIYLGGNKNGLELIQTAYDICRTINDRHGLIQCTSSLVAGHCYNGRIEQARGLLIEAEQWIDMSAASEDSAAVLISWTNLYKTIGDPDNFMEYSRRLLGVSESIDYRIGILQANHNIGFLTKAFGDLETAFHSLQTAIAVCREDELEIPELSILCDMIDVHMMKGRLDDALTEALRAEALAVKLVNPHLLVYVTIKKCTTLLERGEYDSALQSAKELTQLAKKHSPILMITSAYYTRANAHKASMQFDEALVWFGKSLEAARKMNSLPHMTFAYEGLADVCAIKGDMPDAYRHYAEFLRTHEQLMGAMRQAAVASKAAAMELEKAERDRDRIQAKIEELKLTVAQKQQLLTSASLLAAEKEETLEEMRTILLSALSMPEMQARKKLSTIIATLGRSVDPTQALKEFERQLQIADPAFTQRLTARFRDLTPTELKICSLLRANLTTKDIAALLSVQPSSVDMYRSAIRKKLELPKETNLTSFLREL